MPLESRRKFYAELFILLLITFAACVFIHGLPVDSRKSAVDALFMGLVANAKLGHGLPERVLPATIKPFLARKTNTMSLVPTIVFEESGLPFVGPEDLTIKLPPVNIPGLLGLLATPVIARLSAKGTLTSTLSTDADGNYTLQEVYSVSGSIPFLPSEIASGTKTFPLTQLEAEGLEAITTSSVTASFTVSMVKS